MPLFVMHPTTENYEITTRKYFGPTKYPRENILDPQRHDGTRPTMACDPGNLAHSN